MMEWQSEAAKTWVYKIQMPWEVSPDNEIEKVPHQPSPNLSQTIYHIWKDM